MTPLIKFEDIYLKREDLNITGSAKDRAIQLQIVNLKKMGFTKAVISSTGNAAISALYYCNIANISLDIFISPHINKQKLKKLDKANLHISSKPISDAFKFSKQANSYFLRQSTDPIAQIGYSQIGEEILKQLPKITCLFVPVGSGTTLLGISGALPSNVKVFAVQPASHHPIASVFDRNYHSESLTITDSLSVKFIPLKQQVLSTIKNRQGGGVVVQNIDVIECQKQFLDNNISTSAEGALAYAGYNKAKYIHDIGNYPVILLTGTKR